jgi:VWFA-related protein
MQPGDLVAVVRSSAGLGAFQDFTGDKRVLLDAVERVRWTPHVIGMGASFAYTQIGRPGTVGGGSSSLSQLDAIAALSVANLATTASLHNVVRAMADLPGRKSVIVLSDSLRLTLPDEIDPAGGVAFGSGAQTGPLYVSMRGLVDESVRAGVVFYTVDTRGLSSLAPMASDRLKAAGMDDSFAAPPPPNWVWEISGGRRNEYREGQWGGMFLSDATGGFMVTESNRIDAAIHRVVEDQRGYYLLAFVPPPDSLAPDASGRPAFRRLRVETTRPGLKVRSHGGFYGMPDDERPQPKTPELRLAAALTSPFQSNELDVDVRASYLNAKKNHSYLHVAVVLDAKDMHLTGPPVNRTGVFQILVRAFDVKGTQMDGGIDQTLRINLNEEGYERALKWGLVYNGLLTVPKPGPYQVRAACRDLENGRIGTAADLVDVPKIKGRNPVIGGIILDGSFAVDGHVRPANGPTEFAPGERAKFTFQVMNGAGPLSVRMRLFRDGKELFAAAPAPLNLAKDSGVEPFAKGELAIPGGLEPGEYFMRVDLQRPGEGEDVPVAWQWTRLKVRPPGA